MIRSLLTFCLGFLLTMAQAQKTELRLFLNSGLFSFRGKSAAKATYVNYDAFTNSAYANNVFGSRAGLCSGVSADVRRVTRKNLIIGISEGYESLRSRIDIDGFFTYGNQLLIVPAEGKTYLIYRVIDIFPYAGYRFHASRVLIDLSAGLDLAFSMSAKTKSKGSAQTGQHFDNSRDHQNIAPDFQPRIELSADYKRFGAHLGYSYGVINYATGYIGGNLECYPNLLRFGISYRFK